MEKRKLRKSIYLGLYRVVEIISITSPESIQIKWSRFYNWNFSDPNLWLQSLLQLFGSEIEF